MAYGNNIIHQRIRLHEYQQQTVKRVVKIAAKSFFKPA